MFIKTNSHLHDRNRNSIDVDRKSKYVKSRHSGIILPEADSQTEINIL